jgi:hypothetical protein
MYKHKYIIVKSITGFHISHTSVIKEHKIIRGYNVSREELLMCVIAAEARCFILRIRHFVMLLTFDARRKDRYCLVCEFFIEWS